MARILHFRDVAPREGGPPAAATAGELVAMKHVDLDTVVTTIGFLRRIGRGHLLDRFNREPSPTSADRPAEPRREHRQVP